MNSEELFDLHRELCKDAFDIFKAKNSDYSTEQDALSNFKDSEVIGLERSKGVLVRMLDKMKRIRSFVENGTLAVKEESVQDAWMDILNYSILGYALSLEKGTEFMNSNGTSNPSYQVRCKCFQDEDGDYYYHQKPEGKLYSTSELVCFYPKEELIPELLENLTVRKILSIKKL